MERAEIEQIVRDLATYKPVDPDPYQDDRILERVKAIEKRTAFRPVTVFTNAWVNFGAGQADAGYRRYNGQVELRGVLKNGTIGGTIAFNLPPGYRPTVALTHIQQHFTGAAFAPGVMTISLVGDVLLSATSVAAGNYTPINGIKFDVL